MSYRYLSPEVAEQARRLGEFDLVVATPAKDSFPTVAHVLATAAVAKIYYYPQKRVLLFLSDTGSTDGTIEAARELELPEGIPLLINTIGSASGKGKALRAAVELAHHVGAQVLITVDSDLLSICPIWIKNLADPLLAGYDYVTPFYVRHKYDGTITNTIAYPLTRALYGKRVRQPIGGDFGIGHRLIERFIQDNWPDDAYFFGVDIFMTTTALAEGFEVAQAALGAKVHEAKDPASSLGPMFKEVVGTAFELAGRYRDVWAEVKSSEEVEILGTAPLARATPININQDALLERFRKGAEEFRGLWQEILGKDTLREVSREHLSPIAWARLVYDYAVAYQRAENHERLMASMVPLYFLMVYTVVSASLDLGPEEFEAEVVEEIAKAFENEKGYLLSRWSG